MEKPHPAECDGKCENCPIDNSCDHVRLTDSQKECVNLFAVIVLVTAIIFLLISVWRG